MGSSAMTLLAMILPGLFTIYLEAGEKMEGERIQAGKKEETKEEYPSFLK